MVLAIDDTVWIRSLRSERNKIRKTGSLIVLPSILQQAPHPRQTMRPPSQVVQLILILLAIGANSSSFCGAFGPVHQRHRAGAHFARSTTKWSVPIQPRKTVATTAAPFSAAATTSTSCFSHLHRHHHLPDLNSSELQQNTRNSSLSWRRVLGRVLDAVEAAGYTEKDQVLGAGLFGKIKQLHNPITYFCLGILAGFRWDWCFKSPVYWFAIGFTIKWYRARYVFKIPVWDRQPNWNNIITNKEQEKDLKAYTCNVCGSTIFIAKTREFFFEGNTGIGGLGCFSCGAKGKENFTMDRERIVEDVGDMDDYFEYERPLDFVSRAERRKVLKEAQGDEERANQILLERTAGTAAATGTTTAATAAPLSTPAVAAEPVDDVVDAVLEEDSPMVGDDEATMSEEVVLVVEKVEAPEAQPTPAVAEIGPEVVAAAPGAIKEVVELSQPEPVEMEPVKKIKKAKAPKPVQPKPASSPSKGGLDFDGLDELDMDD